MYSMLSCVMNMVSSINVRSPLTRRLYYALAGCYVVPAVPLFRTHGRHASLMIPEKNEQPKTFITGGLPRLDGWWLVL